MTRLVAIRKLEGCIDSVVVKELEVDPPVCERVMRAMARDARLQFFPRFPRPYYRIERPSHYVIQGIVGAARFRVTFSAAAGPGAEDHLRELIEGADDGAAMRLHG
jgi:hypothetical protein